jgi:hypothetical protein
MGAGGSTFQNAPGGVQGPNQPFGQEYLMQMFLASLGGEYGRKSNYARAGRLAFTKKRDMPMPTFTTPDPVVEEPPPPPPPEEPPPPPPEPEINPFDLDLAGSDEDFQKYFESDSYTQPVNNLNPFTMDQGLADPTDEIVQYGFEQPTMEEYQEELAEDDEADRVSYEEVLDQATDRAGTELTDDQKIEIAEERIDSLLDSDKPVSSTELGAEEAEIERLQNEIADLGGVGTYGSPRVTMDEYLAEIADQDARDRVPLEELVQVNIDNFQNALSLREYSNLIQDRASALYNSNKPVTSTQKDIEDAEIRRLNNMLLKDNLQTSYESYIADYVGAMQGRLATGDEFLDKLQFATKLQGEDQFDYLYQSTPSQVYTLGTPEGALTEEEFADQLYDPSSGKDLQTAYSEYVSPFLPGNRDEVTVISDPPKPGDTPEETTVQDVEEVDDAPPPPPDGEGRTIIKDPPKPEVTPEESSNTPQETTVQEPEEVDFAPEETQNTVPDEPESVVLSPEEQWYTENYPELQKQITDQYNQLKKFIEGRGFEEGSPEFNSLLGRNTTYQALLAQRSGLYFIEELYNP